jgi:hypothetical protein
MIRIYLHYYVKFDADADTGYMIMGTGNILMSNMLKWTLMEQNIF